MADTRSSRVFGDEKTLQRSSSKADAIRRGNLRISGPIPVQPDIEDEDPAPNRSVVSLRVHEAVTGKRSQLLRDASAEQSINPDTASQDERVQSSVGPLQPERSSTVLKDTRFSNGYASTFGPPYSINTERNSVRTSPRSEAKTESRRKAKGSSFRAAVRRLFGRKSKPVQPSPARHGYHRSDPGGLLRLARDSEPSSTPQRSFSMPIRDITPTSALQSHSPAVQFPRSKELKPLNLRPLIQHRSPHRRATVDSAVLSGDTPGTLPKSYDDPFWDSMPPVEERDIGLAVTIGSSSKRRSRSAGAVRDINKGQVESSSRRRSDEIRYWRASTEVRPMSGEIIYSGIALGAGGPERKVNSTHFRDASHEIAQPLSPRHGRIFDFGPLNEEEMDKVHKQSRADSDGHEGTSGRPASDQKEGLDRTLSAEPIGDSALGQTRRQSLEQVTKDWTHPQSSSLHKGRAESSQGLDSTSGSRPATATPKSPSSSTFDHEQTETSGRSLQPSALMPGKRSGIDLQKGDYLPDAKPVPAVQKPVSSRDGAYNTPQKRGDIFAPPYSEGYIHSLRGHDPSEDPSPLSPNTSTTFEAVSNVLAYERAARKELAKMVYDLRREVAELRSMIGIRSSYSAYGDRSGNDEMQTYRSHSSETMDARKTLERLEGYGRHDDQRVTVIRSRFSGFDSVDDSNGGTNEDDDKGDDNDEPVRSTSCKQEDQNQEQPEHHGNLSVPSTDIESPGSEAFETPTEEASGYAYAYDDDDDDDDDEGGADVALEPAPPLGMRVPVAVGGMF